MSSLILIEFSIYQYINLGIIEFVRNISRKVIFMKYVLEKHGIYEECVNRNEKISTEKIKDPSQKCINSVNVIDM